ncbi:MAG: NUDIX hydrolase [Lachnospiraceae bacterium]|nr:NUDIX hydrolase [Lachnospiraceae bacterium]
MMEEPLKPAVNDPLTEGEDLSWTELHTEHIIKDEWIDFRRSAYRYPDGRVFEPYYSYSRKNFVVVAATDEEGNYILVRQFRQGVRRVTTEFPAGGIEKQEQPYEAAIRELREETGYESDDWTFLASTPANATIADNYAYLFSAKNCRPTGTVKLDETEYLRVIRLSEEEFLKRVREGGFEQAMHLLAYMLKKEKERECKD